MPSLEEDIKSLKIYISQIDRAFRYLEYLYNYMATKLNFLEKIYGPLSVNAIPEPFGCFCRDTSIYLKQDDLLAKEDPEKQGQKEATLITLGSQKSFDSALQYYKAEYERLVNKKPQIKIDAVTEMLEKCKIAKIRSILMKSIIKRVTKYSYDCFGLTEAITEYFKIIVNQIIIKISQLMTTPLQNSNSLLTPLLLAEESKHDLNTMLRKTHKSLENLSNKKTRTSIRKTILKTCSPVDEQVMLIENETEELLSSLDLLQAITDPTSISPNQLSEPEIRYTPPPRPK